MKTLNLLLCVMICVCCKVYGQTDYSVIASNRMIQKHHLPERIEKIAAIDPVRLQVLWNYFSNSFSFNSEETGISVRELLNIQHFDVSEYEHLRQNDQPVSFIYRGSILITLKSGNELNALLQGYNLQKLITELPPRAFPLWTIGAETSEANFLEYKKQVWDWAKDYPQAYLTHTSDQQVLHIRFSDFSHLNDEKQQELLSNSNYILVD